MSEINPLGIDATSGEMRVYKAGDTVNGATPGGSDTQIQFNDGGSFGGDADFTWSKTTNKASIGSTATAGIIDFPFQGGGGAPMTGHITLTPHINAALDNEPSLWIKNDILTDGVNDQSVVVMGNYIDPSNWTGLVLDSSESSNDIHLTSIGSETTVAKSLSIAVGDATGNQGDLFSLGGKNVTSATLFSTAQGDSIVKSPTAFAITAGTGKRLDINSDALGVSLDPVVPAMYPNYGNNVSDLGISGTNAWRTGYFATNVQIGDTYKAILSPSLITTSDKTFTFPDQSGTIVVNGGTVSATAQVADITTTNLVTNGAALYRVSYYLLDSVADLTAGTVKVTFGYTDNSGAQTVQSGTVLLTTLRTFLSGSFIVPLASGNITYATSHTGGYGTAKYDLFITTERLN